ncbi:MAG: hypothetical protein CME36_13705 [unclassified Hahellaceae]|nr:hypothetical protein [Hahellaceae bacterium]
MREIMYDQSSVAIAVALFVSMMIVVEIGYRLGTRTSGKASEPTKAQINTIQGSLLGILALLLGFTFSLALQRFDARSVAVVDEANAIGTTALRAQLLPDPLKAEVTDLLKQYTDNRVGAATVALDHEEQRAVLLTEGSQLLDQLWLKAIESAEMDGGPVRSGLFIQALNDMIDEYTNRDAVLSRHVPELVLMLLHGTFLMTGLLVGYASGVSGHRASFVSYILIGLIVLLVFIIIDLDRPRRGLIEVDQKSLLDLQRSLNRP